MKTRNGDDVVKIRLTDKIGNPKGTGLIWEARPGRWSWAHPNGSEGCDCKTFRCAEDELLES